MISTNIIPTNQGKQGKDISGYWSTITLSSKTVTQRKKLKNQRKSDLISLEFTEDVREKSVIIIRY